MTVDAQPRERLWLGPYGRVVAGIFSLAFLVAFEAMAVATIMPAVADDLDGLGLYALAFAATSAIGVISMTIAGPMMDRQGPGGALRAGVAIFAAGLVIAGLAPTMELFLVGRCVQGLGSGFIGVGLYVVIGKVFPDHLRARVWTVMTGAWVLPALVGPVIAGFIADLVGWRWVFLGVPLIAIASVGLIWQALSRLDGDPDVTSDRRRVGWAAFTAAGILGVSVAGQRGVTWWPVLLVAAIAVTFVYGPRLLPRGTWLGRRGLPSIIATRSLLSAGFFGAETYVPLSLVQHRGLSVSQAGLLLTSAAVSWSLGSIIAANLKALESKLLRVRLGAFCVLVGTTAGALTLIDTVPVVAIVVIWSVGGLGMGMAASTLGVLLLDHSPAGEQGVNSAAMQTSDAVVQSLVLAIGSVVFAIMLTSHAMTGYVLVFVLAAVTAATAVVVSTRLEAR
ncbi:MFS transporter [Aeromicrobium panaciterrae]|uniref:MFS transporter n=1 Tax=Aeromicrobium panaciterrae TaxID=363861 RepID=UPI0031D29728